MGRIRVLYVTHTVVMAGANNSMLRLMQELRENYGVEPEVLIPQVDSAYSKINLYKACKEQQIKCYSYRFYWFKGKRNWKAYLKCLSNVLWYPRILWKMRSKQYDIIHSNSSVISLGAFICRVKHTPHVWHLREYGLLGLNYTSLLGRCYEKWVYQHGDLFIAISNSLKAYYSDIIPLKKIRMIYNGVLPPEDRYIASHQNNTVQFCMVGVLVNQKRQIDSLKAANILVNKWNVTGFHLSFIGLEEATYAHKLHEYIDENGLSDYVSFMGEHSNISALLCHMDVGLMLSSFEAFGRVTVEYMMHGMAVIASDSGANPEIVENSVSGIIYPLGDIEELARQMRVLINDRTKILEYADKGKRRALKMFTSLKNTEQIYQIYQTIISQK